MNFHRCVADLLSASSSLLQDCTGCKCWLFDYRFSPLLFEQNYQSDPFNFLGRLDWGGDGGASINLPVVFRLWSRLPALSPVNPIASGLKGRSMSLLERLGVLGASVKEFSRLAETSASLLCSCFCRLSNVSSSFRSSICSTQTAFWDLRLQIHP